VHLASAISRWGIPASYIKEESSQQLDVIKSRRLLYTPHRAPIDPAGRTVIVTDDGLATGATMMAALKYVRARKPQKLVAAIPVAAPDSLEKVKELADEVICLNAPDDFEAVGQFYYDFAQVNDDEVVAILRGGAA
jgi:predicted phosphoribosyltransferase